MQFAGTVTINAPRLFVWDLLMDHAVFVKISPGVQSVETLVPNERFAITAGVSFGNQTKTVESEIIWEELVVAEKLVWSSAVPFGSVAVLTKGDMLFSGTDSCEIEFSAELHKLPTSLPPSLVHTLASKHLRSFFTNLKTEAENRQQIADNNQLEQAPLL